jgi:hypothetical protein
MSVVVRVHAIAIERRASLSVADLAGSSRGVGTVDVDHPTAAIADAVSIR